MPVPKIVEPKAVAAPLAKPKPKPLNIIKAEDLQPQLPEPMPAPPIPSLKPQFKPTPLQKEFISFIDKNEGVGIAAHKAGAGKCIVGGSYVQTNLGLKRIEDLAPKNDMPPESYAPLNDIGVIGSLGADVAKEFYYDGFRDTLRVETDIGLSIEGTRRHRLLTISESGQLAYKQLEQFSVGDYVAVSRDHRLFPEGWDIDEKFVSSRYPNAGRVVLTKMPCRQDFFKLLGLLTGDASISRRNGISFSSEDDELLFFVRDTLREFGVRAEMRKYGDRCRYVIAHAANLVDLLAEFGLSQDGALSKSTPVSVLEGCEDDVRCYLAGLLDSDGSVYKKGRSTGVSFSSGSRRLLEEAQLLLLNLGVIMKLRVKRNRLYDRDYYELSTHATEQVSRIKSLLPLLCRRKMRGLESTESLEGNTNRDVIPHIGAKLKELYRLARTHSEYRAWWKDHPEYQCVFSGRRRPSYSKAAEILDRVAFMRGTKEFDSVASLLSRNYLWVRIKSLESGFSEVFDLVVPETTSFTANGIVNHNTAASIMAFLNLMKKGRAKKALVVVPAALRANYANKGVKKFTDASVGIIGSKQEQELNPDMNPMAMGDKDFYVISYAMFKKDPNKYLGLTGADTIIADEMHRMKDPKTQVHKVINKVRPNIQNFIGLTASPAMNNPFEAVSLINAISKKKITPAEFQKQFYERGAAGFKDWFFGLLGHEMKGPIKGWKQKARLGKMVGSYHHFAEPKLEDMPEKDIDVIRVPMSAKQTQQYRGILEKRLTHIERKILEEGQLLPEVEMRKIVNKVMAARQIANNTGYVKGLKSVKDNPKVLSMMIDTIEELKKNPRGQVVMFSQFVDHGTKVLEQALKEAKIPYATFTGRDPKKKRQRAVEDFNMGKIKVIVASGAGGEGLDLPNTTLVQMMDGHYNPEKIIQAEARGIRKGGLAYLPKTKRKVKVRRYVAVPADDTMSIDEKIYDIAAKKHRWVQQFKEIVRKWQKEQKGES
jgi:superfamily II DNA or RNA helicase/intein/homing endonuclease